MVYVTCMSFLYFLLIYALIWISFIELTSSLPILCSIVSNLPLNPFIETKLSVTEFFFLLLEFLFFLSFFFK